MKARLLLGLLSLRPARCAPPHTALLVRGYNPTDAMITRWTAFARSCRTVEPPVVFAASLDVTNRSKHDDFERLAPIRAEGGSLHGYTERQLLRRFPGLAAVAARYAELTGGRGGAYKMRKRANIEFALMLVE